MPDRPLRVAVVGRSIYGLHAVGGLERALYELVRHHLSDGWEVTLITRPADGEAASPDAWNVLASRSNFTLRTVPYRTFPFAGRRGTTVADRSTAYPLFGYRAGQDAARLVAQGRIDLVHSAGASGFGYAYAHQGAGGPRAPLVLNPHGLEEFGDAHGEFAGHPLKGLAYAPLRRVVRATAAAADAVIATDAGLRPVVVRHLGVDPARVHVIPNGLDLVEGAGRVDVTEGRALRQAQGIDPRDTVLLSVGRLEANKGFLDLVQVLATLRESSWRWVLIGDGPERQEIEDALGRAALRDRVTLAGRVDDRRIAECQFRRRVAVAARGCRDALPRVGAEKARRLSPLVSTEELARHPEWRVFDCRHDLGKPDWGAQEYANAHLPGRQFAPVYLAVGCQRQ